MAQSDIFDFIAELEEEIAASKYAPFSKANKVIDEKIVLEIIEDIKNSLHDELDASIKIMNERDEIISAAESQATDMVKKARREADQMIKQEEIYKQAVAERENVLNKARQYADTIKKRADQYAEDSFNELEQFYNESLELVRESRNRIYDKQSPTIITDDREPEEEAE